MANYSLLILPSAAKELEDIPKRYLTRIVRKIEDLPTNPRPQGCEKLSGQEKYRVRQGDYRIIYEIRDRDQAIIIVKVGHRREVYR